MRGVSSRRQLTLLRDESSDYRCRSFGERLHPGNGLPVTALWRVCGGAHGINGWWVTRTIRMASAPPTNCGWDVSMYASWQSTSDWIMLIAGSAPCDVKTTFEWQLMDRTGDNAFLPHRRYMLLLAPLGRRTCCRNARVCSSIAASRFG